MFKLKHVVFIFGGLILLVGIFIGVVFLLKTIEENRKASLPVIPVTFENISDHEGDKVSIEGEILLGSYVDCDFIYSCFEPYDQESVCPLNFGPLGELGDFFDLNMDVYLEIKETTKGNKEPNTYDLPFSYKYEDLKIITNDGRVLTEDDPLRVEGIVTNVERTGDHTYVYICVSTIDAGE